MNPCIILPYDGSSVARAALCRAAHAARQGNQHPARLIVATAGVDAAALGGLAQEAQAIAGADVPLEVYLLSPGDPIGALHRLADSLPDAILAAPLGANGNAPWYAHACRFGGLSHTIMLFFIEPREIRKFEVRGRERRGMGGVWRFSMPI